jgi:WD40 repeat protein
MAVAITVIVVGQQRRIAAEKVVADALQLAAQSRSVVQKERDLAALLAVAGARTHDNLVTREAVIDAVASQTGPVAYLLPTQIRVTAVADTFTASGAALVGCADGSIRVLEPGDGGAAGPTLTGHKTNVTALQAVDGLIVSADASGVVMTHRVGSAEPTHSPVVTRTSRSRATAVAYSSSASQIFVATVFGAIERWQVREALIPLAPLPSSADIIDFAVDDAADQIVGINRDGSMRRWRASTGAQLPDLARAGDLGTGTAMRLSVVARGKLVAISGSHLGIWDLWSGERRAWVSAPRSTSLTSSPDPDTVFVGTDDGAITPWRLGSGPAPVEPVRYGLKAPVVALAGNTSSLVGVDQDGRAIGWDVRSRRSPAGTAITDLPGGVDTIATSPTGALALSGSQDRIVHVSADRATADVIPLGTRANTVAWTAAGLIAIGTQDGRILELDPAENQVRTIVEQAGASVVRLAASAGGKVAAAFSDGRVFLIGDPRPQVRSSGSAVTALTVSQDGSLIAVASGDGSAGNPFQIAVHSTEGDHPRRLTLSGHGLEISSVVFSPDNRQLASGSDDMTIRIWSLEQNTVEELRGHTDKVLALAYSPDGKTLASGSQDGTVKLWDVERRLSIGQPLRIEDDQEWSSLATSAGGSTLVAANGDSAIEWPFTPGAWTDRACRLVGREITPQEWSRLGHGGNPPKLCS